MIRGVIGASARPLVEVRFYMPRLNRGLSTQFMIDTGADSTSIGAKDWQRIRLPSGELRRVTQKVAGFGGLADVAIEAAQFELHHEDGLVDAFRIDVEVVPVGLRILPSILGRDVLERYRLTFSPREGILTLGHPE